MKKVWFNKQEFRRIPNDKRFVSIDGKILTLKFKKPRLLSLVVGEDGYHKISHPEVRVHQAVLLCWKGPRPKGAITRHLDNIATHNHVSNLEWGTHAENGIDQRKNGLRKGNLNPAAKMTEEMVVRLREEYKSKPLSLLVKENKPMSKFAIWAAVSGYTWRHLPGAIPLGRKCNPKYL